MDDVTFYIKCVHLLVNWVIIGTWCYFCKTEVAGEPLLYAWSMIYSNVVLFLQNRSCWRATVIRWVFVLEYPQQLRMIQ